MSTTFSSPFAKRLEGFLEQKRALGYSFNNVTDFKLFDRMCAARFPGETELTAEICNAWAVRRGSETAKTINRRLPFIREFARYLIRNGENAHIYPVGTIKSGQRYMPHIYSHAELIKLWEAAEDVKATPHNPAAHIIMPATLRLLYCTGIRRGI